MIEARQMSGAGPWLVANLRQKISNQAYSKSRSIRLCRNGRYRPELSNVEWRRESHLAGLERLALGDTANSSSLSRLYIHQEPLVTAGIHVAANLRLQVVVWKVSRPDEAANEC